MSPFDELFAAVVGLGGVLIDITSDCDRIARSVEGSAKERLRVAAQKARERYLALLTEIERINDAELAAVHSSRPQEPPPDGDT